MVKKTGKNTIDMVNGTLGDKIVRFVIPLAVTGILQQCFNAMDVMIVGRNVGSGAMAAVGSNAPIVGLFINLFIGISLGANVVIARFTGQENKRGIERGVHTAILFSVLAGICIAVFGIAISRPLLEVMGVPEDIMPMALAYIRIYMGGMPVILLYNFEASILRSQGDTRTPLICLVTAGILNVILNLFFVKIVGMTADGVALATVISNIVSAVMMLAVLLRHRGYIRLNFRKLRIDRAVLKEMLRIGIPAGIQSMVFSVSNMLIQSSINGLGADAMAGSSAAFNIEIIVYFVITSFGQACTTFTGQNYGAGKRDRCKRTLRITLLQGTVAVAAASLVILVFSDFLLGLFNDSEAVIAFGRIRLFMIVAPELINMLIDIFSGSLRGFGYSLIPAVISVAGICGTRIIWVFTAFAKSGTFLTLMICYPLSWAVTAALIIIYYLIMRKRMYAPVPAEK